MSAYNVDFRVYYETQIKLEALMMNSQHKIYFNSKLNAEWENERFKYNFIKRLMRITMRMNINAVNARYPNDEGMQSKYRDFPYNISAYKARYQKKAKEQGFTTHRNGLDFDELAQVIKNLDGILYQCCEGGIPEKKFFKYMTNFAQELKLFFCLYHPSYNKAKWCEY